jgi:timeless protein
MWYNISLFNVQKKFLFIRFSQLIGYRKQLDWIQKSLLTVCSARLSDSDTGFQNPIVCLSLKMKKPCWIIPWTEVEASALLSKPFKSLLYRIGLLQFDDQQAAFPRIPLEWSVDTTYSVALFFGPVEQQQVNFSLNRVTKVELPFSSNFYDGIAGLFI